MILIPAMLSSRLVTVRDLVPQLPEVLNLCDNLPVDAAVLVTGSLAETYPQTVRSYCQVPVAKDRQQPTRAQLKQVQAAAQAHHRRLYLLFTDSDEVPGDTGSGGAAWQQISCVLISHWNATLNKAVANHGVDKRMLYLGEITPEGMVTPAPLSRPPLWAC
jgi:hypothetical protein